MAMNNKGSKEFEIIDVNQSRAIVKLKPTTHTYAHRNGNGLRVTFSNKRPRPTGCPEGACYAFYERGSCPNNPCRYKHIRDVDGTKRAKHAQ